MNDNNNDIDKQPAGSVENASLGEAQKKAKMKIVLSDELEGKSNEKPDRDSVEEMEEDNYWRGVIERDKKGGYELYLETYPNGKYSTQATGELYYRFVSLGKLTKEECTTYLERYPDARYTKEMERKFEELRKESLTKQLKIAIPLCIIILGCFVYIIKSIPIFLPEHTNLSSQEKLKLEVHKERIADNKAFKSIEPDIEGNEHAKEVEFTLDYISGIFKLGLLYNEKGEYDRAIMEFSRVIERNPDHTLAYFNRGFAYSESDRHGLAVLDYSKVIELDPDDPAAYYNRGLAYKESGRHNQSIQDYSKAIELGSADPSAYYNRGFAYNETGRYNQAIMDYSKTIELDPDHSSAYHNRGYAYNEQGEYDRAIQDFSKAIELDPGNSSAYHNRGYAYIEKGEYDRAVSDYSKVIEIKPDDLSAYYTRGMIYNVTGNSELARDDLEKAREMGHQEAEKELDMMQ